MLPGTCFPLSFAVTSLPAVAAGVAVAVAVAAVALLAVRLRRWMVERGEVAAELDALRAASKDAIVGVDLTGTIVSWSAGAEALYGYGTEEATGRPLSFLWA